MTKVKNKISEKSWDKLNGKIEFIKIEKLFKMRTKQHNLFLQQ